jgi:hypothetical protein
LPGFGGSLWVRSPEDNLREGRRVLGRAFRFSKPVLAFWLALSLLPAAGRGQEEPVLFRPPDRAGLLRLQTIAKSSLEPVEVAWKAETGKAASLAGRFPFFQSGLSLEGQCLNFLKQEEALLGSAVGLELRLVHRTQGLGTEHLRFQGFLAGIPVCGAEVAFHLDVSAGEPALTFLTSGLPPSALAAALPAPRLSPDEAAAAAEASLGRRPRLRGPTRAALEVLSPARLVYAVKVDSLAPRGLFLVLVDAGTGETVASHDLLRYAPQDGTGKVFLVNPIVALKDPSLRDQDDSPSAVPLEAYHDVVLRELDGDGGLTGPYVTTAGTPEAVRRVRLIFNFLRDEDGFEEVMAYYHIDSAQRFFQGLGFQKLYKLQIPVFANSEPPGVPFTEDQAYYQPDPEHAGTGAIAFGSGGVDDAEDPEVIIHEYGHAIQDNQVPGFGGRFEALETGAIGEGFGDWLAATYLSAASGGYGDACLGEWDTSDRPLGEGQEPPACRRRLDSTKHYPEDLDGEPHDDGEMWSASLWKLFQALGREDSLKLVLQSNFYLKTDASFDDAARAVLRADHQLFQGVHETLLQDTFSQRGFLAPPPALSWFYVRKLGAGLVLSADGTEVDSKLKIVRAGLVSDSPAALKVYVKLLHPAPGLIDLSLRSPGGTEVRLINSGARWLPPRPLVFGPDLEPAESLSGFAGEPVAGLWTLRAANQGVSDGRLLEWGLGFEGFVRGDANRDGAVDLSDGIALLQYLFLRGRLDCPRGADFNDDGSLSVTDAIGLILFSVGHGPPPADPYPEAGEDLTPDGLSCGG